MALENKTPKKGISDASALQEAKKDAGDMLSEK